MALPVAHAAVAIGASRSRDWLILVCLALLSLLPDFDWVLVWAFGLDKDVYHRTFSHSLLFALLLTFVWGRIRPARLKNLSTGLFFFALFSHALLDLLCTSDAADHGIMLLWPLSEYRLGWPALVPLYRVFASTPFTLQGFVRFTLLEISLALPLWFLVQSIRSGLFRSVDWFKGNGLLAAWEDLE